MRKIRATTLLVKNASRLLVVLRTAFWLNQNESDVKSMGTVSANVRKVAHDVIQQFGKYKSQSRLQLLLCIIVTHTDFESGKKCFYSCYDSINIVDIKHKRRPKCADALIFQ